VDPSLCAIGGSSRLARCRAQLKACKCATLVAVLGRLRIQSASLASTYLSSSLSLAYKTSFETSLSSMKSWKPSRSNLHQNGIFIRGSASQSSLRSKTTSRMQDAYSSLSRSTPATRSAAWLLKTLRSIFRLISLNDMQCQAASRLSKFTKLLNLIRSRTTTCLSC